MHQDGTEPGEYPNVQRHYLINTVGKQETFSNKVGGLRLFTDIHVEDRDVFTCTHTHEHIHTYNPYSMYKRQMSVMVLLKVEDNVQYYQTANDNKSQWMWFQSSIKEGVKRGPNLFKRLERSIRTDRSEKHALFCRDYFPCLSFPFPPFSCLPYTSPLFSTLLDFLFFPILWLIITVNLPEFKITQMIYIWLFYV